MKKYSAILLFLVLSFNALSQELNCKVNVSHRQVQGTNTEVYQTLRTAIFEFMNNQKWTDHLFESEERIDCNILINIKRTR